MSNWPLQEFWIPNKNQQAYFSSIPSDAISVSKLLQGNRDFFIHLRHEETTSQVKKPKTILINDWRFFLWPHWIERLLALGFKIYAPTKTGYKQITQQIVNAPQLLFNHAKYTNRPAQGMVEQLSQNLETSRDHILVINETVIKNALQILPKEDSLISTEAVTRLTLKLKDQNVIDEVKEFSSQCSGYSIKTLSNAVLNTCICLGCDDLLAGTQFKECSTKGMVFHRKDDSTDEGKWVVSEHYELNINQLKTIEKLDLSTSNITDALLEMLQFSSLKELTISDEAISEENIIRILEKAHNLEVLNLPNKISALPPKLSLPHLKRLAIEDNKITEENLIKLLASTSQLENLVLYGNFSTDILTNLNLATLKTIELTGTNITSDNLVEILTKAGQLEQLILFKFKQASEDILIDVSLPNLKAVNLYSSKITANSLANLLTNTSQLEKLCLFHCEVKGKTLSREIDLAKAKEINLNNCEIHFDVFKKIIESAPELELISIAAYTNSPLSGEIKQFITKHPNDAFTTRLTQLIPEEQQQRLKAGSTRKSLPTNTSSAPAPTQSSASSHRPSEINVDAVPAEHGGHISITRTFFGRYSQPGIHHERLSAYNTLDINPDICLPENAFKIKKESDLQLKYVNPAKQHQDVFTILPHIPHIDKKQFYGKCELVLDGSWQALPSLSANETLTHYHLSKDIEIEFQYSKQDNLYYIRSKDDKQHRVEIDFVVSIPKEKRGTLPTDIQAQINELNAFGSKPLPPLAQAAGQDYLAALRKNKTGACRHRAILFKNWMSTNHPEIPCRIIYNSCHAFIEVQYNDRWHTCDLGGTAVNLTIDNHYQPNLYEKLLPEIEQNDLSSPPIPEWQQHFIDESFPCDATKPANTDVFEKIFKTHGQNLLLEINSDDGLYQAALHLQNQSVHRSRPIFRIDSPDDLICSGFFIQNDGTGQGLIQPGPGGALYDFLTKQTDTANPPLLLINYDRFKPADIVRFNQLLDETRLADGTPVPKSATIIGLINPNNPESYQGSDFYSRFHQVIPLTSSEIPEILPPIAMTQSHKRETLIGQADTPPSVNLFSSTNWQQSLIGGWGQDGEKLTYKQGALQQAIEQDNHKLVIQNPPFDHREFNTFIDQARLLGYFECAGKTYHLPKDFQFVFDEGYDWDHLIGERLALSSNIHNTNVPVLNEQTLSTFLGRYVYDKDHQAIQLDPGLFKSKSDAALTLYLTAPLSPPSWARMLTRAKEHNITLQIDAAPGVNIPDFLTPFITTAPNPEPVAPATAESPEPDTLCITTNEPDLVLHQLKKQLKPDLIIDVSEVEASHLLTSLDGFLNQDKKKFEFRSNDGALLTALKKGQTVILKGQFSQALIEHLSPLLCNRVSDSGALGNLVLISEQESSFAFLPKAHQQLKNLTPETRTASIRTHLTETFPSLDIPSLSDEFIQSKSLPELLALCRFQTLFEREDEQDPWIGLETLPTEAREVTEIDLSNSKAKTEAFFASRLRKIETVLTHNPFVFLAGLTGVGKSTFVLEQWKTNHPNCHIGLEKFKDWATDEKEGIKTLFIDEANLSPSDYTQFEGLFNDPAGILIDHKYYPLGPEHKIIFAGNPVSYGDERRLASFFKRHGNSVLFDPLTSDVLYEQIIKPILKIDSLDEETIKSMAEPFLKIQQEVNLRAGKIIISPRELATMALLTHTYLEKNPSTDSATVALFYAHQICQHAIPESLKTFFDNKIAKPEPLARPPLVPQTGDNFTYTPSRQMLAHAVDDLLSLRTDRQALTASSSPRLDDKALNRHLYTGLGGLIVEGEPGIGKSELVIKRLLANGFIQGNPDTDNRGKNCFYKVPVSMSQSAKEKLLLKAFHEGAVVIIDEINSSPMMERLLNSLLTNYTPDGKRPENPGFMLIGTQNPAYLSGRRKASDALNRRLLQYKLPPYTDNEMQEILKTNGLPEDTTTYLIQRYIKQRAFAKANQLPEPCFRDVLKQTKRLKKAYIKNIDAYIEKREKYGELYIPRRIFSLFTGQEPFTKATKLNAANKLKQYINRGSVTFTAQEIRAIMDGNLNKTIRRIGINIDNLPIDKDKPEKNPQQQHSI